ncbi:MAG: fibronectin type III domain-containing protein [Bdellovibrionaceae bacterium]|nr:fibronectin type III domain-containing protein [Pseudobdellovibrionaceae bacterium]
MKWMLSVTVFMMVLAGVFSGALAAGGEEHGDGHHSVGVPQPVADLTKSTLPGRVSLTEPKALAKVDATVTLKWTAATGADVYHVQVAKDPRFKWLVVDNANVTGESFQTPALEAGPYFWRVAGRKPANDATYTKGYFTNSSFEVK